MSINTLKAEKTLNFGDKTFKARMSLDTVIRIEEALGSSILKVGQKLSGGDLSMTDVISILTLSIRAGGNDTKDNDVKELVAEVGLVEAIKICGELITLALTTSDSKDSSDSEKKTNP